jgi:hypothetical protein
LLPGRSHLLDRNRSPARAPRLIPLLFFPYREPSSSLLTTSPICGKLYRKHINNSCPRHRHSDRSLAGTAPTVIPTVAQRNGGISSTESEPATSHPRLRPLLPAPFSILHPPSSTLHPPSGTRMFVPAKKLQVKHESILSGDTGPIASPSERAGVDRREDPLWSAGACWLGFRPRRPGTAAVRARPRSCQGLRCEGGNMLVASKELLLDAQESGYAVAAFTTNNLEITHTSSARRRRCARRSSSSSSLARSCTGEARRSGANERRETLVISHLDGTLAETWETAHYPVWPPERSCCLAAR